jgi:carboxyl-terminal processing protease
MVQYRKPRRFQDSARGFRAKPLRILVLLGIAFIGGTVLSDTVGRVFRTHAFPTGLFSAFAQDRERDQTYQLLGLFGDVFERVRSEYVHPVPDKVLIEGAIDGMLAGLDPHSGYMDAREFREMQLESAGKFGGIGIEVAPENGLMKVVTPIDNTPASRAGIRPGDVITAVDGKPTRGLSLDDVIDRVSGPAGSKIALTIQRQGVDYPLEFLLQREVIHIQVVNQRMEPDQIGYVRLAEFTEHANDALKKAIKSLKQQAHGRLRALILDLRNNPGGLLDEAVAVSSNFIARGEIVSVRARHPEDGAWVDADGRDMLDGAPLVVLINAGSASASEVVAGALQDHRRAVVMGMRSFGKGSVQTVAPLPGGGAIRLTTARYYTPSGRSVQGFGITPDVSVAATIEESPSFSPEREADLNHVMRNEGGVSVGSTVRTDLPPIVKNIPSKPPKGFPDFDPSRPDDTDFQLQQALVVAKAMTIMPLSPSLVRGSTTRVR